MTTEVRPVFEKAPPMIVVKVSGKTIVFKLLRFSKAQVPMVVTWLNSGWAFMSKVVRVVLFQRTRVFPSSLSVKSAEVIGGSGLGCGTCGR